MTAVDGRVAAGLARRIVSGCVVDPSALKDVLKFFEIGELQRHDREAGDVLDALKALVGLGAEPTTVDLASWLERSGRRTSSEAARVVSEVADHAPTGSDPLHDSITLTKLIETRSDDEDELAALAAMQPIEYDRARVDAAERLNIRVTTLEEVARRRQSPTDDSGKSILFEELTPWDEAVDGAELVADLTATFSKYVVLPKHGAVVCSLWVMLTYVYDAFDVCPILAVLSPQKQCGKTTLLSLLSVLTSRPLLASNLTAAVVFRAIEHYRPTLLVDEADTFLRQSDELRGVLNSGHHRAGAFVLRNVGDNHEPAHFSTWAPKAIAAIGSLPPTLEDRALVLSLQRKEPEDEVQRLDLRRSSTELGYLARRVARWASDNHDALRELDPQEPEWLGNRQLDNWRPLLAISDLAGGEWPGRVREAARAASTATEDSSHEVELLSDLREVWPREQEQVFTQELLERLHALEDRPWPAYGRSGRPISAAQIARILKPFEIRPSTVRRGNDTAKGYKKADFERVWRRYLRSATDPSNRYNVTSTDSKENSRTDAVARDSACDGLDGRKTPAEQACDGVTDLPPFFGLSLIGDLQG